MNVFNAIVFGSLMSACVVQKKHFTTENTTEKVLECDSTFETCLELVKTDSFPFTVSEITAYDVWDFEYVRFMDDSIYAYKTDIISNFHDSLQVNRIWSEFGLDSIFSEDEIESYRNQDLKINPECFPDYQFISRDSIRNLHTAEQKGENVRLKYFSFSRPLLSANENYMLMEMEEFCGLMCASAWTYLFTKKDGRWFIFRRTCRWVA